MQRVRWTSQGPDMGGQVGAATTDPDTFLLGKPPRIDLQEARYRPDESLSAFVKFFKGAAKASSCKTYCGNV
jgi:hypothetical protein